MKKISILAFTGAALFLAGCNSGSKENTQTNDSIQKKEASVPSASNAPAGMAQKDLALKDMKLSIFVPDSLKDKAKLEGEWPNISLSVGGQYGFGILMNTKDEEQKMDDVIKERMDEMKMKIKSDKDYKLISEEANGLIYTVKVGDGSEYHFYFVNGSGEDYFECEDDASAANSGLTLSENTMKMMMECAKSFKSSK
jgi:hypothetical protein